jgi:hypothetical protein
MIKLTLTCENPKCALTLTVESKDKKSASAIYDYGKVSKVSGKVREFNCLMCGHPLVKAGIKPSKILSDSRTIW